MEPFVQVRESIAQITGVMGVERWVTVSAIFPLLHKLLHIYLAMDLPLVREIML